MAMWVGPFKYEFCVLIQQRSLLFLFWVIQLLDWKFNSNTSVNVFFRNWITCPKGIIHTCLKRPGYNLVAIESGKWNFHRWRVQHGAVTQFGGFFIFQIFGLFWTIYYDLYIIYIILFFLTKDSFWKCFVHRCVIVTCVYLYRRSIAVCTFWMMWEFGNGQNCLVFAPHHCALPLLPLLCCNRLTNTETLLLSSQQLYSIGSTHLAWLKKKLCSAVETIY